jgi:thermitase
MHGKVVPGGLEQRGGRARKKALVIISVAFAILGALLIAPVVSPAAGTLATPDGPLFVDSQLLVRFTPETGLYRIDTILSEKGLKLKTYLAQIDTYHAWTPPGQAEAMVEKLRQMPEVLFVELNYITRGALTPNDPIYGDPTRVYAPQLIGAEAAWETTTGNAGVVLAVVDSGINATHEDLSGRVLSCDGQVCDFWSNDSDPADDEGHGTHVSGIAAASIGNRKGIAGIAGGVSILPVKVLSSTNTSDWATISSGIIYAADRGARVINLSLGGWSSSETLLSAVRYAASKGAFIVAAAGNGSSNAPFYPAAYEETFAVSSTDRFDQRASTSNYGPAIDIAAPGEDIWSTYWTASTPVTYASLSGSSMAAPHVSGVAALVFSAHPNFGVADVRQIIQQSAVDLGTPGPDPYFGAGRVDAGKALALAAGWTQYTRTPTAAPTATRTPTPTPQPVLAYVQRVNAGGITYTDKQFRTWAADKAYAVGSWGYTAGAAKSSSSAVAGTDDDFLYQKYREGVVEYRFTVPNGTYDILLKFSEFGTTSKTDRLMTVNFESGALTDTFSVYALAGAKAVAVDKTYYTIPVKDGVLNVAFSRAAGARKDPDVSGIEVRTGGPTPTPTKTSTPTTTPTPSATPTVTNTPTPYAQSVNCGGTTFTDKAGGVWSADKVFATGSWGYTTGTAKSATKPVAGTEDDLLYQKYREKPGEYRFTVPNGTYEVTLRFAEFVVTTATARNMTVSFEGVPADTFSVYGVVGLDTALDKVYTVSVTDGILNVGFARGPGAGKDPDVSAIKVRTK